MTTIIQTKSYRLTDKEHKKLKELCDTQTKAVQLVFDYYRYFMNLNDAKRIGSVHSGYSCSYNWHRNGVVNAGGYSYSHEFNTPYIYLASNYKTASKQADLNKLKTLIMLSPDMHCEEEHGYLRVKSINLELPSIKNNSLGLERKL